jgi:hypothetical protein
LITAVPAKVGEKQQPYRFHGAGISNRAAGMLANAVWL